MDRKQIFDELTNIAVVVVPLIVTYQAAIMGLLPQDDAVIMGAANIIFGILNRYSANIRRE